jgi:hypothetical protein
VALINKILTFVRKPLPAKWAAMKATFGAFGVAFEQRRLHRLLAGAHAPPDVFRSDKRTYIAYRPDSDVEFRQYPELAALSEKWIHSNHINNAGDLPRLYALILNIKQVFNDNVEGSVAELGVYRGNSAALLAHYGRLHNRTTLLFDTFEGFDQRDLVGIDQAKRKEFASTSLEHVREVVGNENVRFIPGRFPDSIPPDVNLWTFALVHIDCDLYEPAKAGLEFFYPRLSPGGLLILHDYANPHWTGVRRAVDDYCRAIPERPIIFGDKSGTAMIRKSAALAATKTK